MKTPVKSPLDHMYEDEADLLRDVKKWLEPQRRDGIMVMPIRDRYAKGYSDLFICVRGILVVAELKDNVGKASPHQLKFIKEIEECGGIGGVCRTVKDVAVLVERAKEIGYARGLKYADKEALRSGLQSAT